jgi:pimeloyl-ACP methyl ester carboxylesterase
MNQQLRNSRMKLSGGRIFWREIGEGAAVVLLHGSWQDSGQWVAVMNYLSLDHHCFAPDLLGFGDSEHPQIHYSIDLEVECLAEYLEALKLRHVYLVGHSLGAWVAASYALKYPDQVGGLVLLAPEGVQLKRGENTWQPKRQLLNRPSLIFKFLRSLRPLTKMLGLHLKIEQAWNERLQLIEATAACQLLFQRRISEIEAELLQEKLFSLQIPVLILQSQQDTKITAALCQAYAHLLPKAQLKVIGEGDDTARDLSETIAADIREFIRIIKS